MLGASKKHLATAMLNIAAICIFLLSPLMGQTLQWWRVIAPTTQTPLTYAASMQQGLYESCSPKYGARCLRRLEQMAAAGFVVVINYDQFYGSAQQQLVYAEKANALGMKIIWNLSDPAFWNGTSLRDYYSDLAPTCHCSNNETFIRYIVRLVNKLPATWGYYVGDEVKNADHAKMKAFASLVKRLDPLHPRLYITSEDTSTGGSQLRAFADSADVIGEDFYPVGAHESISAVRDVAYTVQAIADQNGKQAAIVLQAFSWAQYPQKKGLCAPFPRCARFPTRAEMQLMRRLTLSSAHPLLLLWYSYFDILNSDNPAGHWKDLVQVANSVVVPKPTPTPTRTPIPGRKSPITPQPYRMCKRVLGDQD